MKYKKLPESDAFTPSSFDWESDPVSSYFKKILDDIQQTKPESQPSKEDKEELENKCRSFVVLNDVKKYKEYLDRIFEHIKNSGVFLDEIEHLAHERWDFLWFQKQFIRTESQVRYDMLRLIFISKIAIELLLGMGNKSLSMRQKIEEKYDYLIKDLTLQSHVNDLTKDFTTDELLSSDELISSDSSEHSNQSTQENGNTKGLPTDESSQSSKQQPHASTETSLPKNIKHPSHWSDRMKNILKDFREKVRKTFNRRKESNRYTSKLRGFITTKKNLYFFRTGEGGLFGKVNAYIEDIQQELIETKNVYFFAFEKQNDYYTQDDYYYIWGVERMNQTQRTISIPPAITEFLIWLIKCALSGKWYSEDSDKVSTFRIKGEYDTSVALYLLNKLKKTYDNSMRNRCNRIDRLLTGKSTDGFGNNFKVVDEKPIETMSKEEMETECKKKFRRINPVRQRCLSLVAGKKRFCSRTRNGGKKRSFRSKKNKRKDGGRHGDFWGNMAVGTFLSILVAGSLALMAVPVITNSVDPGSTAAFAIGCIILFIVAMLFKGAGD
jgi:hypothetical protein